jgi:Na+-transporting methylmalonyl-CoA/oxaloacetate decarboxylase beta subunit
MFGLFETGFAGCAFLYLGIAKKMEPLLLVPIGFGVILVNLLRECGVTDRLADTAANAFMNILTILVGVSVGADVG